MVDIPATILALATLITAVTAAAISWNASRKVSVVTGDVAGVKKDVAEVKLDVNSNFTSLEKKFDESQRVVTQLQDEIKTLQAARLADAKAQVPMMQVPATMGGTTPTEPLHVSVVPDPENPVPVVVKDPKAK